jgi:Uma2 family endonuclease
MVALAKPAKMTVEEFLAWAAAQPGDGKYELIRGGPVLKSGTDEEPLTAMVPERFAHAEAKFTITVKLKDAIRSAGVPCQAVIDGVGVAVDGNTTYIPDAVVNCGEPIAADGRFAANPIVVVEVLSLSTKARDFADKFTDYFRVPSIQHYLIVDLDRRLLLHHKRGEAGTIVTAIIKDGTLRLDPPGIEISLAGIFEPA